MSSLYITDPELDQLGKIKFAKNFILILRGRTHIRLDQAAFDNGNLSSAVLGTGGTTKYYAYQISSFHVKVDDVHQVTQDPETLIKTIKDWSDYLYFTYVDAGVWQPIWGYDKFNKSEQGRQSGSRNELTDTDWGALMETGRKFIHKLGQVTRTPQNMACGPIQGASATLINQL
jgi:hypothetical protein